MDQLKTVVKSFAFFICSFIISILISSGFHANAASYDAYVMSYFTSGSDGYGLNLCFSTDGTHWTALNNGKAVVYPSLGAGGLRDPYLYRKQDGSFVVVATNMKGTTWSDHSPYIFCWDSDDLITFENERLLEMHTTDMHTWAPEIFYDYGNDKYGIIWSGNTDYNRIYVNFTNDFTSVTSNEVFFDPGYDVIDADIIQYNGTAYMFFKDERSSGKAIKIATSSSLDPGSFSVFSSDFITSDHTEGPMTFKDNYSDTWYLYADLFSQDGEFECWKTDDLEAATWEAVNDISLPAGVRHGSIVNVTQDELDRMVEAWGVTQYYKIINRNSEKLLDVASASTDDGGNVLQWKDNGGANQHWAIIENGDNYYEIMNENSGKLLDVSGGSTADGGNVLQWTDNGGTNQQWSLTDLGDGYYKIINRNSGKALNVADSSTEDGANVEQYADDGSMSQQWLLEEVN